MRVADFDYELPEDLIALEPAPRGSARLLHVGASGLADRVVRDLPSLLRAGDLLVLNDTRVIPAQLKGRRAAREGGAPIEIDATLHMRLTPTSPAEGVRWRAFVRPAKRLKEGDALDFGNGLRAIVEAREDAEALLRFDLPAAAFEETLAKAGAPPLPPYIARKRGPRSSDAEDYQTIFARAAGSVAAPTAGLHFTEELFTRLEAAGIGRAMLTLHVGAGTFLPVTAEDTKNHRMHAEVGEIAAETAHRINETRAQGGRIVAVGTTALRLLESAADEAGRLRKFAGSTSIFITPGYRFRAADLLMTNFHLPRSTLFMLACAFAGTARMKAAYAHAIEARYRFYSFGDASLLERAP